MTIAIISSSSTTTTTLAFQISSCSHSKVGKTIGVSNKNKKAFVVVLNAQDAADADDTNDFADDDDDDDDDNNNDNTNSGAGDGKKDRNPSLPELKDDYDWDERYGGDEDWIMGDQVPGRIVLNDIELAEQSAALDALEEKWRNARLDKEYEAGRKVGWVANAEMLNGRFAMFFLAVGLLTEYWTGITIPGQVEEMLRIGGFIGFD
eukprot:CAMPEP_0118693148 /NCGR_PEP_ID=MMETSP0800-20121206/11735_1 /TAXON_ID=210618 ORGANISM="Striatella unipunctata, Strain CCMP2910" /NCGR_SAMPLE_ID=MMETSP0800 /ASSEMBLY_ACC=CAM_ASM_000638 /LENGTH=205 /DNA_ID=CAMNT_0006591327 /DNA_START=199 /DNA_END=816 /DNA_ORIENTATION=-